ncbi:complexin-2-like [Sycon ciliatum]|uniref:complexin-2-like n=1 Tax=Sycon ciliatum TaxID=27933 RepID=UPI0020AAC90C|eukprot:scpid83938/ scgid32929/ 
MAGYVAKAVLSNKTSSMKESLGMSEKKKGPFNFGDEDSDEEKKKRNKKKADAERLKEEQAEAEKRRKRDEDRATKHADRAKQRNDIRAKYGLKPEAGAARSSSPPAKESDSAAPRRGSQSGAASGDSDDKCSIM